MNAKLQKVLDDGLDNLQVVLDFDGTITEGKSLLALFRDEGGISKEYVDKAQALYDYYRPIELMQATTEEEVDQKNKKMTEWWQKHIQILIHYGLNRQHMRSLANSTNLKLKAGMSELFVFARDKNIPVIIFSANALGTESIQMVLERFGINFPNVTIHSNDLVFDETDHFKELRGQIVHSENKDEHLISGGLSRTNTILVGDNPSDAKMVLDEIGELVYRIGISHDDEKTHLDKYSQIFDEIISPSSEFNLNTLVDNLKGGADFEQG